ncbi:MAG: poly-gamma-glutamate hydrolase family protein [Thermoactinomyces sp.]
MDRYQNIRQLAASEKIGEDYSISLYFARPEIAILAIHGGGIEPGTSELARAIAEPDWSFYDFRGERRKDNHRLHITSVHFDEPHALAMVANAMYVIAIHGAKGTGKAVYLGGRDRTLLGKVEAALSRSSFQVKASPNHLQGTDPGNIINRGARKQGLQIELTAGLRARFFKGMNRAGRKHPTPLFNRFVQSVRAGISSMLE